MTEQTAPAKKPAFIAFDPTRWAGETEFEGVGVGFAHRDANGYDLLLDAVPLTGTLILRHPEAPDSEFKVPSTGVPAKRPDYHAFVVGDRKDSQGKSRWRFLGHAYKQSDGAGLDLLYKRANRQITEKIGAALLDPAEAARLMQDPATQGAISRLFDRSGARQLGYQTAPVLGSQ